MKDIEYYINLRHQLHLHPGVSGEEQYAHDVVVAELQKFNPDCLYKNIGGYGVVALWENTAHQSDAPTLAFRADIDALPSGHRCGHDGHTAIMLRFAEIVASTERKNNVMLILQPEEETGKGAKKIVQSGLMQKHNVRAVFGLHNIPGFEEGTIVLNRATFAAASCGVHYTLIGRQTHASTPEKGLNPGLAVAEIIKQFDGLNKGSGRQSTLVCCRVGEESFGTSAGKGEVMFTLRTRTNNAMSELTADADRIAVGAAEKYGLELEKRVREPFRATENTPQMVEQLEHIFEGQNIVIQKTPFRWSEDFAEYLAVFPGAFFGLGSGENQPELHHPDYNFPDEIIEKGAKCFELIMNNIEL